MEPKVLTGYSDEQADRLMPIRWPEDREIDLGGISLNLKQGQILRVQDRAVLNIIRANRWKRPIYFAITVSPNNKIGLERYLQMESMALRLVPKEGSNMIDVERTRDLIMNHHIFRGLNDDTVFKDENTQKLLTNYSAVFATLGQVYIGQGKYEEARLVLERALEVLYPFWGLYQVLTKAYEGLGELEKGLEVGHKALSMVREKDRAMIYMNLLPLYQKANRLGEFSDYLNGRIDGNPDEFSAYWALFRTYHIQGKSMDAARVLEKWLIFHPQDENTRRFWSQYLAEIEASKEEAEE
jgi:tetratricopeptide (TPR) repeat protein